MYTKMCSTVRLSTLINETRKNGQFIGNIITNVFSIPVHQREEPTCETCRRSQIEADEWWEQQYDCCLLAYSNGAEAQRKMWHRGLLQKHSQQWDHSLTLVDKDEHSLPDVGSSRKITLGIFSSCKATVSLRFWPPLSPGPVIPPTLTSAKSLSPHCVQRVNKQANTSLGVAHWI